MIRERECVACGEHFEADYNKSYCGICTGLRSRYGIDKTYRDAMYEAQNGECAICNTKLTFASQRNGGVMSAAVDHCHTTGKIRGLLCSNCNLGIGKFNDSIDSLKRAISYLENSE